MVKFIYLLTFLNICVICVSKVIADSSSRASASAEASSSSDESFSSAYAESNAESSSDNDNNSSGGGNEEKPLVCGKNEMSSSCANGGCRRFKCSIPPLCVDLIEGGCRSGCICIENYTRDDYGTCIPEDQCPLQCPGENEIAGCETLCPPETCDTVDRVYKCKPQPTVCKPACRCKTDYYRNNNRECVSKSECRKENNLKALIKGNDDFTQAFLYAASSLNPGISVVYSPFSLSVLLAQLALYASGSSLKELLSVINLSQSAIRSTMPDYLTDLNSQSKVNFSLAEKVYVNKDYELSDSFLRDTKDIFFSKAENVDFSKPNEAAKLINNWVSNKTNGLIPDLVSSDALSRNTRIVLADAIYFKANWLSPFKERNTREVQFFVNENKNVTVKMMNQVGFFRYADMSDLNIQAVDLKYENGNFSYLVLLPKSKSGLSALLEKIKNTSNSVLQDVEKNLKTTSVNLSIPSIKTSTSTDLKDVLEKVNVKSIFISSTDLNGIFKVPEQLSVTAAIQKAFISVNEAGSEAAAANAVIVGVTSALPAPSIVFNADHPYVYFLLYNKTPMFCGIFAG